MYKNNVYCDSDMCRRCRVMRSELLENFRLNTSEMSALVHLIFSYNTKQRLRQSERS